MGEVALVVSDTGDGLRARLDEEINSFNAAVTGWADGRLLSISARGHGGDLHAGLFGWTWGGCGYIDLLWVREDRRGSGLGTRLLAAAEEEIRQRDRSADWRFCAAALRPPVTGPPEAAFVAAIG
jgi:GNAT superfamily N-acetyltransferase